MHLFLLLLLLLHLLLCLLLLLRHWFLSVLHLSLVLTVLLQATMGLLLTRLLLLFLMFALLLQLLLLFLDFGLLLLFQVFTLLWNAVLRLLFLFLLLARLLQPILLFRCLLFHHRFLGLPLLFQVFTLLWNAVLGLLFLFLLLGLLLQSAIQLLCIGLFLLVLLFALLLRSVLRHLEIRRILPLLKHTGRHWQHLLLCNRWFVNDTSRREGLKAPIMKAASVFTSFPAVHSCIGWPKNACCQAQVYFSCRHRAQAAGVLSIDHRWRDPLAGRRDLPGYRCREVCTGFEANVLLLLLNGQTSLGLFDDLSQR
mmetsp:Transcript_4531/g.13218  ORF Transcript_4531/g.13218 Transcript_4531/m.13218 type:complete len:311 (+) Transcript_4531:955-1887(+)